MDRDMTNIKTPPQFKRLFGAAMFAVLALCLLMVVRPAAAQNAPQQLPVTTLHAGMYNIAAQLARSSQEREIGLMFRKTMAAHEGMLFEFEIPGTQCFWMRNTLLPLSAAFVDDDGSIVNIEDMAPQTDTSHCSKKPVRFVLEMNQGWFAKRGIKPGARLTGGPFGG
jgi:hypothetical protein